MVSVAVYRRFRWLMLAAWMLSTAAWFGITQVVHHKRQIVFQAQRPITGELERLRDQGEQLRDKKSETPVSEEQAQNEAAISGRMAVLMKQDLILSRSVSQDPWIQFYWGAAWWQLLIFIFPIGYFVATYFEQSAKLGLPGKAFA